MLRRKNQTRVGQVCCAAFDALATWPAMLVTGLAMQSRHDAELASVATANSHSTRYLPTGFAGNKKLVADRGPRQAVKWAGSAGLPCGLRPMATRREDPCRTQQEENDEWKDGVTGCLRRAEALE